MGDPRLWLRRVVPLAPARHRRAGHAEPHRDQHILDRQDQGRRHDEHIRAGRRRRQGCHHLPPRPYTLWPPELGPRILEHRREECRHGRGRLFLRPRRPLASATPDEQQVLDAQGHAFLLWKGCV